MGKKSKKPKAKAPKATKEEARIHTYSDTTTSNSFRVLDTMCTHGLDTSQSTFELEAVKFTKSFLDREDHKTVCVAEWMNEHFDEYINVWNTDKERKIAIDMLVSHGADLVIGANGEFYSFDFNLAKEAAIAILILEEHDGKGNDLTLTSLTHENVLKVKNLCSYREIIRFYHKRITCGCLEDKYKEIKKDIPTRLGYCANCDKRVDRSTLMKCASCNVTLYCSKQCQKEHWRKGGHKDECSKIVEYKKEVKRENAVASLKEGMENGDKDAAAAAAIEMINNIPDEIANMSLAEFFSRRG